MINNTKAQRRKIKLLRKLALVLNFTEVAIQVSTMSVNTSKVRYKQRNLGTSQGFKLGSWMKTSSKKHSAKFEEAKFEVHKRLVLPSEFYCIYIPLFLKTFP